MQRYNDIEIQQLAVSRHEERFLLSCHGRYYEASRSLVELLQALQERETEEEGISTYLKRKDGQYTKSQVERVIGEYIRPLLDSTYPVPRKRTFLYERELLSSAAIDRFSDAFRFLFRWQYMAVIMLAAIGLDVVFLLKTEDLLLFNNQMNVYTVMGLLLFMVVSSIFHELGHASACKFFGIRHGGIGFGLYLNFPVLYTDVTEVWKLKRGQRCIVNLAGVYSQCFILLALLGIFAITRSDMVKYLILLLNLGFLMTLNPFFKFDGYWLASDLLGVPNLRKRSTEWWGYLYRRMRGWATGEKPYFLKINRLERYLFLSYSVLVNLFMGYYFFYIIPKFLFNFIRSFPDEAEQLILYLANQMTPPFALIRNLCMQLLFLALIGFVFINLAKTIKKNVGNKKRRATV